MSYTIRQGMSTAEALEAIRDGVLEAHGFLRVPQDQWPTTTAELLQKYRPILVHNDEGDMGVIWELALQ